MKYLHRILFSGCCCLFFYSADAQIEKGSLMPYGQIGISARSSENFSGVTLTLNPGTGKMLSNHFLVGLQPLAAVTLGDFNGLNYGLNAIARYYFNPETEPVKWFIQGYSQFQGITNDLTDGTYFTVGADAGFNYFLNPNVSLQVFAGPSYQNIDVFPSFNEIVTLRAAAGLVFFMDNSAKATWKNVESAIGAKDIMIGGSQLSAGYASDLDTESFNLSATPNFGFFLTDQWMLGAQLGLGLRVESATLFSYEVSPFARYYFQPEGRKRLFAFARAGVSHAVASEMTFDPVFSADAGAGLDVFITPTVAIEGSAFLTGTPDPAILELNLGLGFQVFLDRN